MASVALGATFSWLPNSAGACETRAAASAVEGIVVGAARLPPVSSMVVAFADGETAASDAMARVVGPDRATANVGSEPTALATRGNVPFVAGSGPLADSAEVTRVA